MNATAVGPVKCEYCDREYPDENGLLLYTDELDTEHTFCDDDCCDAWKSNLSAHERLMLTGETPYV